MTMTSPLSELSDLEKHTLKMLKVLEDYLKLEKDVATRLAAAKKLASLLEELVSTSEKTLLTLLQGGVDTMARTALMRALGQGADLAEGDQVGLAGQLAQALSPFEDQDPQEQLCAIIDPLLLGGKVKEAVERVSELTGWTLEESAIAIRGRQEQLIQAYEQKNTFGQPLEGLPPGAGEEEGESEGSAEDGTDPQELRREVGTRGGQDPPPDPSGDLSQDDDQEAV